MNMRTLLASLGSIPPPRLTRAPSVGMSEHLDAIPINQLVGFDDDPAACWRRPRRLHRPGRRVIRPVRGRFRAPDGQCGPVAHTPARRLGEQLHLTVYSERRNVITLVGPKQDRFATMFAGAGRSAQLATESAMRYLRTAARVERPQVDESLFRSLGVTLQWGVFDQPDRYALRGWFDRPAVGGLAVGLTDRWLELTRRAVITARG
jgi:hypothetical protein